MADAQLTAEAIATTSLAAGYAQGCQGGADACYKTIDLADEEPPLNSGDGPGWVAKVKDYAEQARLSALSAEEASDQSLTSIAAGDFTAALASNATATGFFASAAEQAGHAGEWCTLILKDTFVEQSPYAKGLVASAQFCANKAADLAVQGKAYAEEAAEALGELGEQPGPPDDPSTLDIRAVSAKVDEGQTIVFAISRSGPIELPCSVEWHASGTATAADFLPGTGLAGQLSWAAGNGAERKIELITNPDNKIEASETVTITLSRPVNTRIGTAAATVGITDDDPRPALPYDQMLAYGGTMLGAACQDGGPGNVPIRNQSGKRQNALVMYLESDLPMVAIQTENRIDHFPLGSTAGGYSDHTVVKDGARTRRALSGDNGRNVKVLQQPQGGDIRWRVAKVTSPESSTTLVLEKGSGGEVRWGGQTAIIKNCGRDESWDGEWAKCGGQGHAPAPFGASNPSGSFPTIWFEKPIDPKAMGWKIGDRLAFCIFNTAEPDSGPKGPNDKCLAPGYGSSQYSSLNLCYRGKHPLRKSSYPYLAYTGMWRDSFRYDDRYIPLMLIGHRAPDGKLLVKGNGYVGYAGDEEIMFGGGIQLRQVLRIPAGWTGRRIIGCDAGIWRNTSSGSGSVTMSIRKAGQAEGGGDDQGTLVSEATFKASDLIYGDLKNYAGSGDPHQRVKVATPVAVKAGETYYIALRGSTGTGNSQFKVGRMANLHGRAQKGLLKPDYQNDRDRYQSRSGGGGWDNVDAHFSGTSYLHLGVALFFKPAA